MVVVVEPVLVLAAQLLVAQQLLLRVPGQEVGLQPQVGPRLLLPLPWHSAIRGDANTKQSGEQLC